MAETQRPTYKIRYATEADVPVILQLIQELAIYEKALHEVQATEQSLLESLSFPDTSASAAPGSFTPGFAKTLLICPTTTDATDATEKVAGMAMYFHNYSTWRSRPGIYLEDLFVRPQYRGAGFGTALIQALARECLRLRCTRLEWSVLKWNQPSIDFYEGPSVGAKMMDEWVGMRVDGERLEALGRR